jgi:hypothetical protein
MFLKHIRRDWEVNGGTHVFECQGYSIQDLDNGVMLVILDNHTTAFEVVV